MFARKVTMRLKNNNAEQFTRALEKEVIPMLRKQKGFKDELTFIQPEGPEVVGISLWDKKENAELYTRETFPTVLKKLDTLVEGKPEVQLYQVANSTAHQLHAA